ncbi:MAG: alkaline phosphatase [Phycisphaerae bacterium]|nr:alkaline phosphatase [Phycisphaerae bacterium]
MWKLNARLFLAFAAAVCVLLPSAVAGEPSDATKKPKYIFLMIGDGMGLVHRESAEMYKRLNTGAAGGEKKGKLVMNQFPVQGLTTTYPHDRAEVTDSAAAGTALACGEKTNNGVISMSPDLKTKFKSVAYHAKAAGMKIGIVSSVPIDKDTPAVFYANEPNRKNYYNIALQIPESGFNYFAGDSLRGSRPKCMKGRKSPYDFARGAGYNIYKNREGLKKTKPGDDKIIWEVDIPFVVDSNPETVTLAELTSKGIEVLDNPDGFFMMIEGGKIDWACHNNDFATQIHETLAFDAAVAVVYEFYKKHPSETLIIVTADHETGGLKMDTDAAFEPEKFLAAVKAQKISGRELKKKIKGWNTDNITKDQAMKKTMVYFGLSKLKNLTPQEKAELSRAIEKTLKNKTPKDQPAKLKQKYGSRNLIVLACQRIIADRCRASWGTFEHTGVSVPTTAIGVGAKRFGGDTDNTDIGKKLIELISQPCRDIRKKLAF